MYNINVYHRELRCWVTIAQYEHETLAKWKADKWAKEHNIKFIIRKTEDQ